MNKFRFVLSLLVLLTGLQLSSYAQSRFRIGLETNETDQAMLDVIYLRCVAHIRAETGAMVKNEYQGKLLDIDIQRDGQNFMIQFKVESKKKFNDEKFCEKVREDLEATLRKDNVKIAKIYCKW